VGYAQQDNFSSSEKKSLEEDEHWNKTRYIKKCTVSRYGPLVH
jgi:hypothetical protein